MSTNVRFSRITKNRAAPNPQHTTTTATTTISGTQHQPLVPLFLRATENLEYARRHRNIDTYLYNVYGDGFCFYRALSQVMFAQLTRWIFEADHYCIHTPLSQMRLLGSAIVEIWGRWLKYYAYLVMCTDLIVGDTLFFDRGIRGEPMGATGPIIAIESELDMDDPDVIQGMLNGTHIPSLKAILRRLLLIFARGVEYEQYARSQSRPAVYSASRDLQPLLQPLLVIPWNAIMPRATPPGEDRQLVYPSIVQSGEIVEYSLWLAIQSSDAFSKGSWQKFVQSARDMGSLTGQGESSVLSALFFARTESGDDDLISTSFLSNVVILYQSARAMAASPDHEWFYIEPTLVTTTIQQQESVRNRLLRQITIYFEEGHYFSAIPAESVVRQSPMNKQQLLQLLYPTGNVPSITNLTVQGVPFRSRIAPKPLPPSLPARTAPKTTFTTMSPFAPSAPSAPSAPPFPSLQQRRQPPPRQQPLILPQRRLRRQPTTEFQVPSPSAETITPQQLRNLMADQILQRADTIRRNPGLIRAQVVAQYPNVPLDERYRIYDEVVAELFGDTLYAPQGVVELGEIGADGGRGGIGGTWVELPLAEEQTDLTAVERELPQQSPRTAVQPTAAATTAAIVTPTIYTTRTAASILGGSSQPSSPLVVSRPPLPPLPPQEQPTPLQQVPVSLESQIGDYLQYNYLHVPTMYRVRNSVGQQQDGIYIGFPLSSTTPGYTTIQDYRGNVIDIPTANIVDQRRIRFRVQLE